MASRGLAITVRLKADTSRITVRLKANTTGITGRLKADTTGDHDRAASVVSGFSRTVVFGSVRL
jgi:hypothetical protein